MTIFGYNSAHQNKTKIQIEMYSEMRCSPPPQDIMFILRTVRSTTSTSELRMMLNDIKGII